MEKCKGMFYPLLGRGNGIGHDGVADEGGGVGRRDITALGQLSVCLISLSFLLTNKHDPGDILAIRRKVFVSCFILRLKEKTAFSLSILEVLSNLLIQKSVHYWGRRLEIL